MQHAISTINPCTPVATAGPDFTTTRLDDRLFALNAVVMLVVGIGAAIVGG